MKQNPFHSKAEGRTGLLRRLLRLSWIVCLLATAGAGCTRDNEIEVPVAGNFQVNVASAYIGDIITVTGENMHLVTKFRFGSTDTPITTAPVERDPHRLFITVPACVKEDGEVELSLFYNSLHQVVLNPHFMVYIENERIPIELQVNGTKAAPMATRAYNATWEKGDRIGVSLKEGDDTGLNIPYVTAEGDGRFTAGDAPIVLPLEGEASYTAYYPYQPAAEGGTVSIDLAAADVPNTGKDLLFASASGLSQANPTAHFAFRHVLSRLVIAPATGIERAELSGVSTTATLSLGNGTVGGSRNGTLRFERNEAENTLEALVVPGTVSGTLTVVVEGKEQTATFSQACEAGQSYTFGIPSADTGLTQTAAMLPTTAMTAWSVLNDFMKSQGWDYTESPNATGNTHTEAEHAATAYDSDLGLYAFCLTLHLEDGNIKDALRDGTESQYYRQRNELKSLVTSSNSAEAIANPGANATEGSRQRLEWKMKLPAGWAVSPRFTHIHQLKGVFGSHISTPVITFCLSLNADGQRVMQVKHAAQDASQTVLEGTTLLLDDIEGHWLQVEEECLFAHAGTYRLRISEVSTRQVLLDCRFENLDMWRDEAGLIRNKFGIYRQYLDEATGQPISGLKEESIFLTDFKNFE